MSTNQYEPWNDAANGTSAALLEDALFQVKRVIVGQDRMVERALVCLLAGATA